MKCHERASSHHYHEISPTMCDSSKLPDVNELNRTCNKIICKPEWKIESDWTSVRDSFLITSTSFHAVLA